MALNLDTPGHNLQEDKLGGPYHPVINEIFFPPHETVFCGMGKLAIRKSFDGRRGGGWVHHKAS